MENGLVERVNQLETLFETEPYSNSNTMVKSHIVSLLEDSDYKEFNNNKGIYHRLNNNSIDIFGFKYKQKDQIYHAKFDDVEKIQNFVNQVRRVDNFSPIAPMIGGGALGFAIGMLAGLFTQDLSSDTISIEIPLLTGMACSIAAGYLISHLFKSEYEDDVKKLEESSEEIAFGFDALKSAVGEY